MDWGIVYQQVTITRVLRLESPEYSGKTILNRAVRSSSDMLPKSVRTILPPGTHKLTIERSDDQLVTGTVILQYFEIVPYMMGDYAKQSRAAQIKCIACNSPVVLTVDKEYICVDCGKTPVQPVS